MRLGIMQPYFAPGLGYFDLIHLCDRWIVFDTAQFKRHGWMNRNRVLHPRSGWQYIIAKLAKHPQRTPISEIRLLPGRGWRDLIVRQLEHYRKRAPHFEVAQQLVRDTLASPTDSLTELNLVFLTKACALLDLPFEYQLFSRMDLELGPIEGPGDWALRISEALGADEYVNPPGGEKIFDPNSFARASIELCIRRFEELAYEPRGYEYVPGLSVVDVLMWNSAEAVRRHLDEQRRAFLERRSEP